ncbi:MAG: endolytic transglycosylase MltG [Patescibacteria group bacterium]
MNIEKKVKILALASGAFLFLASFSLYLIFSLPKNFAKGHVVAIEDGTGLKEIASQLSEQKIIKYSETFRLVVQYVFGEKSVKAGDYFFKDSLSVFGVARRLTKGDYGIEQIKIVVPEGATIRNIGFIFENLGMWQAEEFWEAAGFPAVDYREIKNFDDLENPPPPKDFSSITSLLKDKPAYVSFEGYLFPDTYFFPKNITPEGVVIAMLKNFDKKIDEELRKKIKESGRSFFEILTAASIIEKEASEFSDRELISGILWKRLKDNMLLQVDAPFVYAVGKNTFQLTKKDLAMDSPYNTYRYKGLPLGPIANPGISAIKAALAPKESPYWYYLSDYDGNVHFSEILKEHKAKKAEYLGT